MSPKILSHLLRARNLRVIAILLILLTTANYLTVLYTFFNGSDKVVPAPYSRFNDDNTENVKEPNGYLQVYISQSQPTRESPKRISRNGTRGNTRLKGRRDKKKQQFLNRTSSVFSGRCEQIQEYIPDIDANKIYPTLPFEVISETYRKQNLTINIMFQRANFMFLLSSKTGFMLVNTGILSLKNDFVL